MKHVYLDVTLPELKGGAMYQTATGDGSTDNAAIARAFRELRKKIKGKRACMTVTRLLFGLSSTFCLCCTVFGRADY